MKKILFTLFAFALVIVACEKDMDNNDSYNIEPIEAQVENIDLSEVKDILNGLGFTGELQERESSKGSSNLTARTNAESTAANCIDNRPSIPAGKTAVDFQYLPIDTSSGYFVTRGGGDTPLLLNRPVVRFLIGSATEDMQLQLFLFSNGSYGNAIPLGTSSYNAVFAFLAGDGYITIDRTDLYLDSLTGDAGVTPAAAGMACATINYANYYEVIPAPFPLTGFLATMRSDAPAFTGSSANYAGTTRAAVEAAIQGDINDGQ